MFPLSIQQLAAIGPRASQTYEPIEEEGSFLDVIGTGYQAELAISEVAVGTPNERVLPRSSCVCR